VTVRLGLLGGRYPVMLRADKRGLWGLFVESRHVRSYSTRAGAIRGARRIFPELQRQGPWGAG